MAEKFSGKYRIETTRLQNWDYGWRGKYFITICSGGRECFFGKIINKKIVLSDIGEIVKKEWLETPKIRADMNLKLDMFQIMPNHFHGIIEIGKNQYNLFSEEIINDSIINSKKLQSSHTTNSNIKSKSLDKKVKSKKGPQSKNLSSIIRGFKSSVKIKARKINKEFYWHSRFDDRIIRDRESLYKIRNYIINNPKNWDKDKFHPKKQNSIK